MNNSNGNNICNFFVLPHEISSWRNCISNVINYVIMSHVNLFINVNWKFAKLNPLMPGGNKKVTHT